MNRFPARSQNESTKYEIDDNILDYVIVGFDGVGFCWWCRKLAQNQAAQEKGHLSTMQLFVMVDIPHPPHGSEVPKHTSLPQQMRM